MKVETLVTKYIATTEKALHEMKRTNGKITLTEETVDNIVGYVKAYLNDAKYYKDQKKFETSLTSVAYCEGLLDALKIIGAIKIPTAP